METESPLLVSQMEIMQDSAGVGEHRGGFGGVYTITAISPTVVTVTADCVRRGAEGSNGGGRGMSCFGWYIKDFDREVHMDPLVLQGVEPLFGTFDDAGRPDPDCGVFGQGARYNTGKIAQLLIAPGDAMRIVIGGGGGWGNPLVRDADRVENDVRNGLYSKDFAAQSFGVVFDGLDVDVEAAKQRRDELAAAREAGAWTVPAACPPNWVL